MPLLPIPFLCVLVPFKNKHFVMLTSFISGCINDYLMAYVTLALWVRVSARGGGETVWKKEWMVSERITNDAFSYK